VSKPRKVSRQYEWQMRQKAAGCCVTCGQPRDRFACECNECRHKATIRGRLYNGNAPWLPGADQEPVYLVRERLQAQAVEMYESGHTLREVGALLGVNQTTVLTWLTKLGIARRPKGTRSKRSHGKGLTSRRQGSRMLATPRRRKVKR
jgi:hypothetical protein